MDLSERILQYAMQRGCFSLREIKSYLADSNDYSGALPDAAIANCLRRLKSRGYIINIRQQWYVRLDKVQIAK